MERTLRAWMALSLVVIVAQAKAQTGHAQLRAELERMHDVDQNNREHARRQVPGAQKDSAVHQLMRDDSLHLLRVTAILDSVGWLGAEQVGKKASQTLWLVLQHGDGRPDVQAAYLPMMRDAVAAGLAEPHELAMLEDRVEVNHGRPQIYGSQIGWTDGKPFVKLLIEEEHVNERRAAMGMEPLEKYAERFGLIWSPPVRKERLLLLVPAKP